MAKIPVSTNNGMLGARGQATPLNSMAGYSYAAKLGFSPSVDMDAVNASDTGQKTQSAQRTYRLSRDQQQFLADELNLRGMPHDHVAKIKFVEGVDDDASDFSKNAINSGNFKAITQGNTIYVHHKYYDEMMRFDTDDPFEELCHTSQFAGDGGAGFELPYLFSSAVEAPLSGQDFYKGNIYEVFAKGAAKEMRKSYRSMKRKRW